MVNVGILHHDADPVCACPYVTLKCNTLFVRVTALNAIHRDPLVTCIDCVDTVVTTGAGTGLAAVNDWQIATAVVADCNGQPIAAVQGNDVELFEPHATTLKQDAIARP
jgi:hypothetical protein